mmetsp:Transcript_104210/g.179608  ORF Transcript_104210/g.179608 Transcript_104210/m.179608 type:complete len:90 (+) Transcript_104210:1046-1315(+)
MPQCAGDESPSHGETLWTHMDNFRRAWRASHTASTSKGHRTLFADQPAQFHTTTWSGLVFGSAKPPGMLLVTGLLGAQGQQGYFVLNGW